jgi:hypothetical protein
MADWITRNLDHFVDHGNMYPSPTPFRTMGRKSRTSIRCRRRIIHRKVIVSPILGIIFPTLDSLEIHHINIPSILVD